MTRSLPLLLLLLVVPQHAAQETRVFHYGEASHEVAVSRELVGVGLHRFEPDSLVARHPDLLAEVVRSLELHRVAVLRVVPGHPMEQVLRALRRDEAVDFAHPVHHLGDPTVEASWHLLTRDLCVGLASGLQVEEVARRVGARPVRAFSWPGTWQLRLQGGDGDALEASEILRVVPGVRFAHPDWLRRLEPRFVPNDPLFSSQWHLWNTGQSGGTPGADVRAQTAWDVTRGDPATVICVIDSGVERSHADITQTPDGFNALCGAGPLMGDPRPTGCSNSYAGSHGTSVAGVAAADIDNGTGVAGIAGDCVVMPINLLGNGLGFGTPSMEAACFDYATANGAAVITNSWGPDGVPWPLPSAVQAAFVNAVTNGRGGLGCCIFWAAGNGNELISSDGYASSPYTMAVAASTNQDLRAFYSDFGPEVDFCAPSNGGTASITTTSTTNSGATTYTSAFGGTSSSAPLGAGVGALVLSANPQLTWTAARTILRDTAVQIDASSSVGAGNFYDPQTGHSPWYGHGRLDAHQAVLAAQAAQGGISYTVSTTGVGDLQLAVGGAAPAAELFILFAVNPTIPVGTGPVFGLPAETFLQLGLPLGTDPFHVLSDGSGGYAFGLPSGVVPAGWTTHSRVIQWAPVVGMTDYSGIEVTSF